VRRAAALLQNLVGAHHAGGGVKALDRVGKRGRQDRRFLSGGRSGG
jgi:hypothetical protein